MPGTVAGTVRFRQSTVASATLLDARLLGTFLTRDHHACLEHEVFVTNALAVSSSNNTCSVFSVTLRRTLERMVSIHQYFRFNDRHDIRLPGRALRSARAHAR
jgi:hypothetical protein